MEFSINKGVNRPLDFYGLKEQNIIYFAVGLVIAFGAYFILAFIHQVIAISTAFILLVADYLVCYFLNQKYGVHGLTKSLAMKSCPQRIQMKRVERLLKKSCE